MRAYIFIAAFAAWTSNPVIADVEIGSYEGTDLKGETCQIKVIREWHENGLHHGLNHRVQIQANDVEVVLGHPPIVDAKAGTVRFDHDRILGTTGAEKAGIAMIMEMDHSPGSDGPKSVTTLYDHYINAAASTRWTCDSLKYIGH